MQLHFPSISLLWRNPPLVKSIIPNYAIGEIGPDARRIDLPLSQCIMWV
ncbi:hypothetical protein DBT_0033 [Dissulfuribacter thermophilus]|uniref:Uncharacterized protein n=1 Tax=Dissulfuribacter thermophilus TaxID=1156395 RepID=A0A1B9F8G6_9BACT|nr:hypothetical protein DBT_0033 [Dissulfuribacter thermophilus]